VHDPRIEEIQNGRFPDRSFDLFARSGGPRERKNAGTDYGSNADAGKIECA
jgi:hypothetical protein